MYLPEIFEETRPDVLWDLLARRPLGLLVTAGPEGPMASPLPFLRREAEGRPVLAAHMARANPHVAALAEGMDALVIFQGADAYVTPGWYPSKAEAGKVVPTWNYAVVHARGSLVVRDDPAWLRAFLETLTDRHESGRAVPWKVGDAPEDFIQAQLRAIVGIEIPLTALVGKWKMSQNRPPADRAGVIRGLQERNAPGDAQIAAQIAAGAQDPEKR